MKSTFARVASRPGKNSSKVGAASEMVVKTRPVLVICVRKGSPSELMASMLSPVRWMFNATPANSYSTGSSVNLTSGPPRYQDCKNTARRSSWYSGKLVYQDAGRVLGGVSQAAMLSCSSNKQSIDTERSKDSERFTQAGPPL